MDVRDPSRIALAALLMAALSVLSPGQSRPASYDPAAGETAKPQEGFIDFTWKRMNPADHDFGQCFAEGRALLLDESVRKGYFWSNLVALSLLGCLFLIILFQYRLQARRDWNVARIMGQYEQALARSHAQLEQVTKSNHGLNTALAAIKVLRSTSQFPDSPHRVSPHVPAGHVAVGRASKPQNTAVSRPEKASRKPAVEDSSGIAAAASSVPHVAPFKADPDIVGRINTLEQQLAYAQEDNKQLRQRIAESERRIEVEQQKNRQLKGV